MTNMSEERPIQTFSVFISSEKEAHSRDDEERKDFSSYAHVGIDRTCLTRDLKIEVAFVIKEMRIGDLLANTETPLKKYKINNCKLQSTLQLLYYKPNQC